MQDWNRTIEEVRNEHVEEISALIAAECDALGIEDPDEYREEMRLRIVDELQARRREILDDARMRCGE